MSTSLTVVAGQLAKNFGLEIQGREVIDTLKQTAFKTKQNDPPVSDAQMMALLVIANQYHLNPFTKEIYAYPDKGGITPVVGVDGWNRIMNEHPQMDGIEFKYSPETREHKGKVVHEWVEAIIYRKDRSKPTVVREYFDEVARTLNYTTPWDSHPKRMHRHKASIQAARIAFGFAGIYDEDEADRIREAKDITDTANHAVRQTAQPKAAPTPYTDAEFDAKASDWKPIVEGCKKTANDFIAFIEQKGRTFTDAQKLEIASWEPIHATYTVDEETGEIQQ